MNNQLMAKVLFSNGLATKEQIGRYWEQSSDARDIGSILRDAGIIEESVYGQVVQFISQKEWNAPGVSSDPMPPPPPPPPSPPSPERPFGLASAGMERSGVRIPEPAPAVAEPTHQDLETSAPAFSIEGNNPFGEGFGEEVAEDVKALEGLQDTRLVEVPISLASADEGSEFTSKLPPKDWTCGLGLGSARTVPTMVSGPQVRMEALLLLARRQKWNDLYLTPDNSLWAFQDGLLQNIGGDPFGTSDLRRALNEIMDFVPGSLHIDRTRNLRVGFAVPGAGRFRLVLTWTNDGPTLAIHLIPLQLGTWSDLAIPAYVHEWVECRQGLILLGGVCGSGTSATANRMAASAQQKSPSLVEVIAEPLEFLWNLDGSTLFFELGLHGLTQEQVLRDSIRRAPGVLVVERCHGCAERMLLLEAAESGCLVIATMEAFDAMDVLERFEKGFCEVQKAQVGNLLSRSLRGVLWQGHKYPQPQFDGFTVNPALAALVRKNELGQIRAQISTTKGVPA